MKSKKKPNPKKPSTKAWYADRNDQTMRGGELLEDAMFCLLEQERGDAQEKQ